MAAAAAVVGARRARAAAPPRRGDFEISEERKQAALRKKVLNDIIKKYDVNKTKKLERDQVVLLLTDLDDSTPVGTAPADEEVDFIMKVADKSGDGALERSELEDAIQAWKIYTEKRTEMEEKVKQFDTSGSGKLEKPEVKEYLKSLNGGKEVSDAEVEWVLAEADYFSDGALRSTELVFATAAWYAHVEEKRKSSICTLL
eukprot:TRINITY_DN78677_c0_g1_i1.p1 TRINITY_DN78677_c0_g1~~TRINITY_DN78677_c0_g1_i1.p1  ORF type:complete len:221 (+),score=64.32 TRINITY_DN78677_c0_g1_i1:61-663(+)